MSCQENDKIYEAAFEDFEISYFNSDSSAARLNELIGEYYDGEMTCLTALKVVFQALWDYDREGLLLDQKATIESLIAHLARMHSFLKVLEWPSPYEVKIQQEKDE